MKDEARNENCQTGNLSNATRLTTRSTLSRSKNTYMHVHNYKAVSTYVLAAPHVMSVEPFHFALFSLIMVRSYIKAVSIRHFRMH